MNVLGMPQAGQITEVPQEERPAEQTINMNININIPQLDKLITTLDKLTMLIDSEYTVKLTD